MGVLLRTCSVVALACSATFVAAQASRSGTSPAVTFTPEAKAYLSEAAKTMVQRTDGGAPFHLKGTFTLVPPPTGGETQTAEHGTFEEIWKSPSEWRRDVTFDDRRFSFGRQMQTAWRADPMDPVPMQLFSVLYDMLPEIPTDPKEVWSMNDATWVLSHVKIGDVEFDRVGDAGHGPRNGKRLAPEFGYYFLPGKHILVMRAGGPNIFQYHKAGSYHGKAVLLEGNGQGPIMGTLQIEVTSFTGVQPADAALLTPPSGASARQLASMEDDTLPPIMVSGKPPVYPELAEHGKISGAVFVSAVVAADGTVGQVKAEAGPPILRSAAVDAVRKYRYKPAKLNGIPTTAEIHIQTNFTFDDH
jgi:TonB family protein